MEPFTTGSILVILGVLVLVWLLLDTQMPSK